MHVCEWPVVGHFSTLAGTLVFIWKKKNEKVRLVKDLSGSHLLKKYTNLFLKNILHSLTSLSHLQLILFKNVLCIYFFLMQIQLALKEHGFEPYGATYMQIFFQ